MTFYMMIGLPGSGKSTAAQKLPGTVLSSDNLREKLPDVPESKIWEMMTRNAEIVLKAKTNVVYDATNLSRKKRQNVLNIAKKAGAKTVAVLLLTPIEICKERNAKRFKPVPEDVIDRMARSFNIPTIPEFDEIQIIQEEIGDDEIEMDFSQENSFHTFTLLKHLQMTKENLRSDNKVLLEAAEKHDVGKAFTKTFTNAKGKPSEEAHYYGHENYGAWWYLTTREVRDFELEVAKYINYHMRPFVWEKSPKSKEKDIAFFGEEVVRNLELLHEADMRAK